MKFIRLIDQFNNQVYVNTENITHIVKYSDDHSIIYFNTSHEGQFNINVRENIEVIYDMIANLK